MTTVSDPRVTKRKGDRVSINRFHHVLPASPVFFAGYKTPATAPGAALALKKCALPRANTVAVECPGAQCLSWRVMRGMCCVATCFAMGIGHRPESIHIVVQHSGGLPPLWPQRRARTVVGGVTWLRCSMRIGEPV